LFPFLRVLLALLNAASMLIMIVNYAGATKESDLRSQDQQLQNSATELERK
jgi:hypothetical protein